MSNFSSKGAQGQELQDTERGASCQASIRPDEQVPVLLRQSLYLDCRFYIRWIGLCRFAHFRENRYTGRPTSMRATP